MKKKYLAPEMEDMKVDDPVVLGMNEGTTTNMTGCPTDLCNPDNCPLDGIG